jgi:hypothetical protein
MTMANCRGHFVYVSRADAERALRELVADAKRTGQGGKSWKRLEVWPCSNHFHVGRANQLYKPPKSAVRKEKLLTHGEARRALTRLDRDLERTVDYCIRKRIEIATRLVELDRAAGWID